MTQEPTVTRADLEEKLAEIKAAADRGTESAADAGRGVLIGGVVLLLVLVFLFGRRRGRKRRTIVEVRRI
jgi:MYXO-CTERM domain-containing protein